MADNVVITAAANSTPPDGTTIATDDVAGIHYQVIKIALGADGVLDTLVDSGQQVMADSLPIVIASDQGDVAITLAGEVVVLGAGAATIGRLAANTGVDIGDVDVTSVPAPLDVVGGGAEATALRVTLANDSTGLVNVGVTSIAAGETHLGEVGARTLLPEMVCSLDAGVPYADGDVLFATQELAGAIRVNGGTGTVLSVRINDKDDQGENFDLYFLTTNVAMGAENAPPSISDANADEILGYVAIDAWEDLGGCQIASIENIGLGIEAAGGATSIFLAGVSKGTGTYTASGITIKVTILAD